MTTVAECSSVDEAMVLKALLEDCGIEAFLPDELAVTNQGMAGRGARLQVDDEDAETARSILANKPQ